MWRSRTVGPDGHRSRDDAVCRAFDHAINGAGIPGTCGDGDAATPTQTASQVSVAPCRLADLDVSAVQWGGAAGNAVGLVLPTDKSTAPCSLQGHPLAVTILDEGGNPIPLHFGYVGDAAGSLVDPSSC